MLPRKSIRLPRISIQRPVLFWCGIALLLVGLSLPFGLPEFIHAYRDDINAVSTIFIAVFTAVLGTFTISLARSTRYYC